MDRIALALSKHESGFCFWRDFKPPGNGKKAIKKRRKMVKSFFLIVGNKKIRCERIRCHV
jgi:hypothetical protein